MKSIIREDIVLEASLIVIKVGTRVLTNAAGHLDLTRVEKIAHQIAAAKRMGKKVVLVSSGAVGAGMGRLGMSERPTDLAQLQAVASCGQSYLMQAYDSAFRTEGLCAGQVLLTTDDFDDRDRYLNAHNTLLALLDLGVVPIINENDAISTEELDTTFGENDRLAALVTNLLRAPLLILLSDVPGLLDGSPDEPTSKVLPTVMTIDDSIWSLVQSSRSKLGTGGMASKIIAAEIVTASGENVIVASGCEENIIEKILAGETIGTLFVARREGITAKKRWIGFTVTAKGVITLDGGAAVAVAQKGKSLLPVGITACEGDFSKGDVVILRDLEGNDLARGVTNYDLDEVDKIKGLPSDKILQVLGCCPCKAVVHRDNLLTEI